MSDERKKQVEAIVELLEKARSLTEEMKTDEEGEIETLKDEQEELEGDAVTDSQAQIEVLEGNVDSLDAAIEGIDDVIDYVQKAE